MSNLLLCATFEDQNFYSNQEIASSINGRMFVCCCPESRFVGPLLSAISTHMTWPYPSSKQMQQIPLRANFTPRKFKSYLTLFGYRYFSSSSFRNRTGEEINQKMAALGSLQTSFARNPVSGRTNALPHQPSPRIATPNKNKSKKPLIVVAAVGDVSSDGNIYLFAGAAAVALVGTAFPILFSRKDTCPECDGAGFVRKEGVTLRANAARKDQTQIVCANCNGLGKLNQVDK